MMSCIHLKSTERRWLSNKVQSDLYLLCADGRVPAHSALLADMSAFLARILAGERFFKST